LIHRDNSRVLDQFASENQLCIFDFVGRSVGSERSIEFHRVGHFVDLKSGRQINPNSFVEGIRTQHHRVLSNSVSQEERFQTRHCGGFENHQALLHYLRTSARCEFFIPAFICYNPALA